MNKKNTRVLILGVGNTLLTDEGLGVHSINMLQKKYSFPEYVKLVDGGTLGMRLMEFILECDELIVLDAIRAGHEPGTVYRLTDQGLRKSLGFSDSMHQIDLADTLIMCELTGHKANGVILGMEPFDIDTLSVEPSQIIKEKLPRLCDLVIEELANFGIIPTEL